MRDANVCRGAAGPALRRSEKPPEFCTYIHPSSAKATGNDNLVRETVLLTLEALAVHDRGTALVVLLLRDPHLLEGRQGGENGTTDPDRVLALGGSNDLDLHRRRSK